MRPSPARPHPITATIKRWLGSCSLYCDQLLNELHGIPNSQIYDVYLSFQSTCSSLLSEVPYPMRGVGRVLLISHT